MTAESLKMWQQYSSSTQHKSHASIQTQSLSKCTRHSSESSKTTTDTGIHHSHTL